MDLGMDGGLMVFDTLLEPGEKLEIVLDVESEWSVKVEARVLSSRPIFFGKQHLTAVTYTFPKTSDRSMFGLWLQQQLAQEGQPESRRRPAAESAPFVPPGSSGQPESEEPVFAGGRRLEFKQARWGRLVAGMTARIPWIESEPLAHDRRSEGRGQVGIALRLESSRGAFAGELLNASFSGACIFISPSALGGKKPWPAAGRNGQRRAELVVSDSSPLLGGRRCTVELVWKMRAKPTDGGESHGFAFGVRFLLGAKEIKRTFIGDLLRRIDYDARQLRKELRFPIAMAVLFRRLPADAPIAGRTLDLGAGGALLSLESAVETPADGILEICLPGKGAKITPLTLSVRFLRQVPQAHGETAYALAFRKGQPEARLKLSRWLARQMRARTLLELGLDESDETSSHDG